MLEHELRAAPWGTIDDFVLIHGSWHGAWCWYRIASRLRAMGRRVHAIDLPGHGVSEVPAGSVALADYVEAVVDGLSRIPGKATLVAHSMGGIVASSVAEAAPDKVRAIIYVAAFMLKDGESVGTIQTGVGKGSLIREHFLPLPDRGIVDFDRAGLVDTFYEHCPPDDIALASMLIRPNPLKPLGAPLSLSEGRYGSVPRYYIRTTRDRGVLPAAHAAMLDAQPCRATFSLDTDHSPFFSRPIELLNCIREVTLDLDRSV